ncbi:MAG: hypothetical protein CMJ18_09750 [Phycisphaeraceae bacterium]|nr:hypothetical protein [Phycisphaeraceae bacterium]
MFPSIRHRLIILAAILICGWLWLLPATSLSTDDGSTGLSLMSARIGPVQAVGTALVIAAPVALLVLFVSAAGNPLAGLFVAGAGLVALATRGGPINGWIMRLEDPTFGRTYQLLVVETLIWYAGLVLILLASQGFRTSIRSAIRPLADSEHLGGASRIRVPSAEALLGGLLASAVGAILGSLLIKSSDSAQVIASLFIAFTIGGLVGQLFFPQDNPGPLLLSSGLVAIATYGYVLFSFDSAQQLIEAWHDTTLPSWQGYPALARALPVHYASAAVAGTAVGIGWAQGIMAGHQDEDAEQKPSRSETAGRSAT